jgi:hypothetical protein
MQFNQVNNNKGDVNNAISEKGNVVQSVGNHNKAQLIPPAKQGFWAMLWAKLKACWKWLAG